MYGACRTRGRNEKCTPNVSLKLEGRRPLGRPRCRCEDYIEGIEYDGVDWLPPTHYRIHWWV
jgi:hypothetical protein